MTTPVSDFDAAKAVAVQLEGLEKDRQQRILRWVAESLGLIAPVSQAIGRGLQDENILASHRTTEDQLRQPTQTQQQATTDIKTFIEGKKPKSDVQFATAVAYYYQFEAQAEIRKATIDASVLQEAARLAGRRRPPNPRMTLNNAKKLGYLDSSARGQFSINSVGENLVAMTLPGDGTDPARRPKRKKAKASKKTH